MKKLELEMISLLKDLKENHNVCGVKTEFEAEGASIEEMLYLKQLIKGLDLKLSIKIGGCEAITDLISTKKIGANSVIVPMVESVFALKKFVNAINSVYSEKEKKGVDFYINIESITGFNSIDNIINSSEFNEIAGVVFGRSDMVQSLNYLKDKVDSREIFEYANYIGRKVINKKFIVGGNVTKKSMSFFKNLEHLTMFETRKVIFDACSKGLENDVENGILKALKFELLWLKNKRDLNLNFSQENLKRINILQHRCF